MRTLEHINDQLGVYRKDMLRDFDNQMARYGILQKERERERF